MVKKHINFIFWIAAGAAIGSMLREGIVSLVDVRHPWLLIAAINMVGSFIIAVVYEIEHKLHDNITIFAALGFCGGFTTLSHFSLSTITMIMNGDYLTPIGNILLSLVGTLAAIYLGIGVVGLSVRVINKIRGQT